MQNETIIAHQTWYLAEKLCQDPEKPICVNSNTEPQKKISNRTFEHTIALKTIH